MYMFTQPYTSVLFLYAYFAMLNKSNSATMCSVSSGLQFFSHRKNSCDL